MTGNSPREAPPDWWKGAVFYQIYPKSFMDANADGIGDLRGILSRLPYLSRLGVDALWLSPVFPSPQKDNGYDVADYVSIDPVFGSMEDFEDLVEAARDRHMAVIMDLVLNHTSDQHPWFQCALQKDEWKDFYIWSDTDDGTEAIFGEPSWTWSPEREAYYYSSFSRYQPDLNWENPRVREAVYDVVRFWRRKGVAGFRLDAVPFISKDLKSGIRRAGPRLHEFMKELRDAAGESAVLCGEDTEAGLEDALLYTAPERHEISMIFEFGLEDYDSGPGGKWDVRPLDLPGLKKHFNQWQQGLQGSGWTSLFLTNHDMPRIASRWGDGSPEAAKAFATAAYLMRGTVFIYQGEELGMTNHPMEMDEHADLETANFYRARIREGARHEEVMPIVHARSRDNARTPMQWTDGKHGGFTSGTPWLAVNPNCAFINACSQEGDSRSVFRYYQQLLQLRRERPDVFLDGDFRLVDADNPSTFTYLRGGRILVECNFTGTSQPRSIPLNWKDGAVLLSSGQRTDADWLRPYEARVTSC